MVSQLSTLNSQLLQHHFDTLAETPAAVAKLRKLVLELGVQGRLVPQQAENGDAVALLKKIDAERARRVAAKELEASPRMRTAAVPATKLPSGWVWSPFGRVSFCRDGERIPVNSDERESLAKTYDYYGASGVIDKIDRYLFDKPLLLIGEDGANLVNRSTPIAFIAHGKYWVNNHAHVLDAIDPIMLEYLRIYINSINLEPYLTGMAQPKMNQAQMNSIPVALPPLAEQRRIVAKVEELLALCDELEARQTAARDHRARLVRSALDHLTLPFRSSRRESALTETKPGKSLSGLTSAATRMENADFRHHAAFVLNAFPNLTAAPEDVPALRQAILSLAVQGHVVPQNSKDEPAAAILNQCQRAARKLGIKTAEQSPPVGADESPFELPSGWAWARLRNVGYLLGGGTPSRSKSELWNGALPWVSPKDMKVTYLEDAQDHISRKALDQSAVKLIPPGSLLFVVRGMILIHSFPAAINKVEVTINQDMKALQSFVPECVEFLLLACRGFKQQMLDNVERSTHGTCKLVTEKVTEFVIGLPPLAEQQRIVAKVEELMRWCDALEARLTAAQTTATCLLDATLHRILNPAA